MAKKSLEMWQKIKLQTIVVQFDFLGLIHTLKILSLLTRITN